MVGDISLIRGAERERGGKAQSGCTCMSFSDVCCVLTDYLMREGEREGKERENECVLSDIC